MNRLAQTALLWYARHLPYHRGKQRLSEALRRLFNVSLEGEYVERRANLWWALNPLDYVQQDLFWSSAKDAADIREALRCMPPDGVMFDLGANFGYYAITIAAKLKGNCRIYAFEPNPPTMRRFRQNLELNSTRGVFPREEGLSDVPGRAAVVDREPDHAGAAYLAPEANAELHPDDLVSLTTLDLFCERQQIDRLHLIKMDIEGAELRALRGGIETLKRFRPVILIELNPDTLERDGGSVRELVELLESLGYSIHTVHPRTPITSHRLPAQREIVNAICTPSGAGGKTAKFA